MQISKKEFKPEIQGLRAIAVLIVVIYHISPTLLPGGYVGVDVFFVISGYLITSHLLREAERNNVISLTSFYAKRIRRLLPAATSVLIVTAIFSPLLPAYQWQMLTKEIIASALYLQNWLLAQEAIDYLAAGNHPSPLQHFWSLAIEEQYYIVWPVLIVFSTFITRKHHISSKQIFTGLLLTIGCLSLLHSYFLTLANPPIAYFSTATRAWELALGGGLALIPWRGINESFKKLFSAIGVFLILTASYYYSDGTRFPGLTALAPTLGAAFVIMGGTSSSQFAISTLLNAKPFQYIGDISYSLYLWHWPLIIFYKTVFGFNIGGMEGLLLCSLSLCAAHLSKQFIEDPFLKRKLTNSRETAFLGIILIMLSLGSAFYVYLNSQTALSTSDSSTSDIQRKAMQAKNDIPIVYELGCHADQATTKALSCQFGDDQSDFRIALIGDSHAAQWIPTLQEIVDKHGWQLHSFTKSGCPVSLTPVMIGKRETHYLECDTWKENLIESLFKLNPNLIILSQTRNYTTLSQSTQDASDTIMQWLGIGHASRNTRQEHYQQLGYGLTSTIKRLETLGADMVAIADTPMLKLDVPTCLSLIEDETHECDSDYDHAELAQDPLRHASSTSSNMALIDMNNYICNQENCPAMLGEQIIWRDNNHITASFARTLSADFEKALFLNLPMLHHAN